MLCLVDLWHNYDFPINNPLLDIQHLALLEHTDYERNRIINGLNSRGIPAPSTPLMLLWMQKKIDIHAIEELISMGADINLHGRNGFNPLFVILSYIFFNPDYIEYLEYWLSIGANPNKIFIHQKTSFNSLEFFLHCLRTPDENDISRFPHQHTKIRLSQKSIQRVLIALLCFNVELPVINPFHPDVDYCRSLTIYTISESLLAENPILEKKLYHLWGISFPISDFFLRHKFLANHYHIIPEVDISQSLEDHEILFSFPYDKIVCQNKEQYFFLIEGPKKYYFPSEIIPHIIQSGKNPLTNEPIRGEIKKKWLRILSSIHPSFECKTLNDSISFFPTIFTNNTRLSEEIYLIEYLHHRIVPIHPYTSIMHMRNWDKKKIKYAVEIIVEAPYQLVKFNQCTSLKNFLYTLFAYDEGTDSFFDVLNTIHFFIEDVLADVDNYQMVLNACKKCKSDFIYSFYDAIMIPDIFEIIVERIGILDITEMRNVFARLCKIHYIYEDLSEDTIPILLT